MTTRPLGLTDSQVEVVLAGARSISISWRSRFLQAVADRLTQRAITDEAVAEAVQHVASRLTGERAA